MLHSAPCCDINWTTCLRCDFPIVDWNDVTISNGEDRALHCRCCSTDVSQASGTKVGGIQFMLWRPIQEMLRLSG